MSETEDLGTNTRETPNLWLAEQWQIHKDRISHLLAGRIPSAMRQRMGEDDLLQEIYLACGRRLAFLQEPGGVPIYVRLRRIALQTLVDMERRHLSTGKRDAMKEINPVSDSNEDSGAIDALSHFADSISSPRTHLERMERRAMTRRVLAGLSAMDREILELRHFEDLSNAECAAVLEITQKTASIRYVRALKRFRDLLLQEEAAEDSRA